MAEVGRLAGRELGRGELAGFVTDQVDAAARVRALQPRAARLDQVSAEIDSPGASAGRSPEQVASGAA